jgi:hypothetical protein
VRRRKPPWNSYEDVITAWASHQAFDAWIETPERDRLTASDVHGLVEYGPITRYDVADGYVSVGGLASVGEQIASWATKRSASGEGAASHDAAPVLFKLPRPGR